MYKEKDTLERIYQAGLDNKPTFSEAMIEHIKNETRRIEEEAIEWYKSHNKINK